MKPDSRPTRAESSPAGIAAAFLVGAAAALGVLGAWKGAARAPVAAGIHATPPSHRRIDINTAGAAELMLLPRVGPAIAQRIIDSRTANGPFRSVEDLARVKGIGPRTIERLRPVVFASTGSISREDQSEPEAR